MSLLKEYIQKTIKGYKAPADKSQIPRGEKLPFTQEKYTASVYVALTRNSLKRVSELAKVPYETVRRWHTEEEFKKRFDEHLQGFRLVFRKYIKELEVGFSKEEQKFRKKTAEEMTVDALPTLDIKEMLDASTYSVSLESLIIQEVLELSSDTESFLFQVSLLHAFSGLENPALWEEMQKRAFLFLRAAHLDIVDGHKDAVMDSIFCLRIIEFLNDMRR